MTAAAAKAAAEEAPAPKSQSKFWEWIKAAF
jgi:hypothetical protein